jgi:aminoglycoside phosphotransferase (APT) family kinase protein
LDDHTREKVLDILSGLQDGDRVCHGDFHPGNIMLTDKGAIVIDWITVRLGNPLADFARTSMILTVGPKGAEKQISPIVMGFIKAFHQIYARHYLHLIPDKDNERHKWLTVMAAARLAEQIKPERQDLIAIVEKGFS